VSVAVFKENWCRFSLFAPFEASKGFTIDSSYVSKGLSPVLLAPQSLRLRADLAFAQSPCWTGRHIGNSAVEMALPSVQLDRRTRLVFDDGSVLTPAQPPAGSSKRRLRAMAPLHGCANFAACRTESGGSQSSGAGLRLVSQPAGVRTVCMEVGRNDNRS